MFRYYLGLFKRERNLNIDSDHLGRCLFTLPSISASCPILSCLYTCTPMHTQWTHGHTLAFKGFPGGSTGKESACNEGALGSIPGLGRSPGEGHGNPLQYSCLENPHGQRSLVDYSPWGRKEVDTTEHSSTHIHANTQTHTFS